MPFLVVLAALVTLPLAELYVILQVGGLIGPVATVLALAGSSLLGTALLRSQGRASWRRFVQATGSGQIPHREVLDGVLVVFGGALLAVPGFITDAVGLLLFLRPVRALARWLLLGRLARRLRVAGGDTRTRAYDVEGTASEQPDDPARHLPR